MSVESGLGRATWVAGVFLTLIAPLTAGAQPRFRGPIDAYAEAAPMRGPVAGIVPPGLVVSGWDAQRGVPNLLVGRRAITRPFHAGTTPAQRAASHLFDLAPLYGVGTRSLQSLEVRGAHATPSGGALVTFGQRVDGVEVVDAELAVLVDGQGALIAAGGRLLPVASQPYRFGRDDRAAVHAALADHFQRAADPNALGPAGTTADGWARFDVTNAGAALGFALDRPVRVQRVLYPLPTRLVPARYLELWVSGAELVAYVVSAEDGTLLMRRSLTDHDAYDYTIFGDGTAPFQPIDSPFGDTTPDALGMPTTPVPPYIAQTAVRIEGLNINPAGASDPWLPPGATESRGNNVDAYADLSSPDGFGSGDLRASTTAAGVFDHVYDPTLAPDANATQQQAAVTHLFYVNNWLHDYFYDVGFDEAAGNAQEDNFGRGGEGSDRLQAQAMDYRGRNNANMSTPRDGSSPRMQMYLWDGWQLAGVESGADAYATGVARFGPTIFDLTAMTALVDDGVGTTTDACEAITNDLTGRIALIDRGSCNFDDKVGRAEAAGAVGVIVMNDDAGGVTITMAGDLAVGIPSLMVSLEDGALMRAAAGASTRMHRTVSPDAASSLDTQVVAHEWAHYLHRRLVRCGSDQCGAESEGWGDFVSLFALMRSVDDLNGAYPTASFSNQGDEPIYFGTRRVPYATNRAFNDLSFRHISDGEALPTTHPVGPGPADNSEIHNAGEIWATMMFDALVAMLSRSAEAGAPYSFDEGMQRMAGYIVRGMQLAPADPTFTEQRDGIIAAALETDTEDARRIARAFADRGAGTCAISPDRYSEDFTGLTEHFDLAAKPTITELTVETTGPGLRCDADALLDAGEDGYARALVRNDGLEPLMGGTLDVEVDAPAVTFPLGARATVPALAPGDSAEVWVALRVDDPAAITGPVTVRATMRGPSLCTQVQREVRVAIDRDVGMVDTEGFELRPSWLTETSVDGVSAGVWSVGPSQLGDGDWVLRGIDSGSITDTAVELPEVTASSTDALVLTFEHRYDFERDDTLWDGGVIELSTDGGASWADVSDYVDPGYDGPLSDTADNPLSLREAYCGENPSFPAADTVRLDFGAALAGERVRFRFRIGTDQATGDRGWEIDDVTFEGVDAPPFEGFVDDAGDCAGAPIADAGPDQEVESGALVMLDATGSSDPDGDPLTFDWEVVGGAPAVSLADGSGATPTFTAPTVDVDTPFTFWVHVSDGAGSSTDEVIVTVVAPETPPMIDAGPPAMPDAGAPPMGLDGGTPMVEGDGGEPMPMDDGGCSCEAAGAGPSGAPGALLLVLGAALLGLRRRRGAVR